MKRAEEIIKREKEEGKINEAKNMKTKAMQT
jgi:hypothetical protein